MNQLILVEIIYPLKHLESRESKKRLVNTKFTTHATNTHLLCYKSYLLLLKLEALECLRRTKTFRVNELKSGLPETVCHLP